ncbi:MAG: hypothetical protein GQ474_05905 [Sulfurimonas sp.]|nr:hypothetical protein [Sulfurimonas sp.]
MILSTEEMLIFKANYLARMKKNSVKILLTYFESHHQDAWSFKVFGSAEYAFMFDVLIPNIEYAIEEGYEVAV